MDPTRPSGGSAPVKAASDEIDPNDVVRISSNLVPILYVKCEIRDAANRVLWSASDRTLTLGNPAEALPAHKVLSDAKLIERITNVGR